MLDLLMVARAASVLFLMLLVCVFHLRSWSIVTPRYLIAVDSSMSTPLKLILMVVGKFKIIS